MTKFQDRVFVVTGATGSIGHPVTTALLAQGARVVGGYLTQTERATELLSHAGPDRLSMVQADVRAADAGQRLVDAAVGRWGRLDGLVTAHSTIRNAPISELTLEDWNTVLAVMLTGVMRVCRAALKPMQKARFGRIVTVTGYQPLAGALEQANYAAALGGVLGFGKALAREVAPWGILINSVAPGLIERPQIAAFDQRYIPWATNIVPLKRLGLPEELVATIIQLVDPEMSYINGQTITIDGGWRMV